MNPILTLEITRREEAERLRALELVRRRGERARVTRVTGSTRRHRLRIA